MSSVTPDRPAVAIQQDLNSVSTLADPRPHELAIGIDIGGTGIKGGVVDLRTGSLVSDRHRIDTPQPATPETVLPVVQQIVEELQSRDLAPDPNTAVGIDFPAIVKNGVTWSAANVDKSWIGAELKKLAESSVGRTVYAVNDADAAGLAEGIYGQGRDRNGLILVITLGTGIGSAMIHNGILVPNSELGHLEIDGHDAESKASVRAREREDLSWDKYGERLHRYFSRVEALFSPDLFVVGGGVSKKPEKFMPYLEDISTPIRPAALQNNAGIVGAALWAAGQPGEREYHDQELED
ncbi:polyphosphate--glucose phosphotransferase [Kocuria sp. HSID16901]|uniref:polyphosphate--glucose phosphotransferase n=1 Tax=Kocuria sp. HSID16901 TaxID=2419505 RepID=UPI0009E63848|nr:ROK family protein [Kocuria sp. HSID16901]RUQ20498.1 ROK family protein [Kocuria sp. HSID16901]